MIVLVLHDIRSLYNVGSILRTADGFGLKQVYMTGSTPYPRQPGDKRLPHVIDRVEGQLSKTALGAEQVITSTSADIKPLLSRLQADGFRLVALEQTDNSIPIDSYQTSKNVALIAGNEVNGLPTGVLRLCDDIIELPMQGSKESFNVSVATGIALYALTKPQ